MTEQEKWNFIIALDEELLLGGVVLSEWSTFLARDAEIAFCSGANLSALLTAQAAIESHLRYEFFDAKKTKGWCFSKLINHVLLPADLKNNLHLLRRFRNKWVHVDNPEKDSDLLERPDYHADELEKMAKLAIESMLRILYLEQFV